MIFFIARLESYKLSRHPLTYPLFFICLLLTAIFFHQLCLEYLQLAHQRINDGSTPSITLEIIKPLCSWTIISLALLLPAFTTTSFSQEYHQRTFVWWALMRPNTYAFVLGKFLSLVLLLILIVTWLAIMLLCLSLEASLDWTSTVGGLLAVFFVGNNLLSLGLFISSLELSPLVTLSLSLVANFSWMLIAWFDSSGVNTTFSLANLSLLSHSYPLLHGVIKIADLSFYFCSCLFWLMLTQWQVEKVMRKYHAA